VSGERFKILYSFRRDTNRSQTEQHNVPEQLNFAAGCVEVREKKLEKQSIETRSSSITHCNQALQTP
jgi:hypothetical protein